MFSAVSFTSAATATVDLLGSGFSLKQLDWSYEYDGDGFPKQSDSDQNPAQSFVRRLIVNMTVQIRGASQSAHWVNRQAFANSLIVHDGAQTQYNRGRLAVTPSGGTAMFADVNVTEASFSMPVEEAAAFVSTATLAFRCDRGYWRTTGS